MAPKPSRRRVTVLFNPSAGGDKRPHAADVRRASARRRRKLETVRRRLAEFGLEVQVAATESADHAAALARAAAQAGEEVVAFGGDGMVRIAASAVHGTDAVLGILPGGRGNDFAAALGIPRDPIAACEVIAGGTARPVDAGLLDDRLFVGVASIGLESEVTPIVNAAPRVGGRAVYVVATLYGLARWSPARFDLDVDGDRYTFTGYLAAVANSGRFGGGMRLAPDARLDDGLLDLVVIEHVSRLRFVRATPKVFKGSHASEPNVLMRKASSVRLDADRQFAVYADGDELGKTPARVTAIPSAFKLRVPRR
ncbi:MAG: diacylglycerol kinase family lipid kinase [Solirubrobacterales bacterium]|nr:diacylglycerol kinase family lipid kinase [Solirubrobacterales bacterium]MBV9167298.1 diacylglycerol kinase family lipid kinase [Solirubrobacterales bacterium]MBV9535713.1 diacylglycerol kinase family lipid kinase [Solirubrobacterales bacterium]